MSRLDSIIDNKIAQNLAIWFGFFIILLGTIQSDSKIITALSIISILVPAVYINNFFVLPFFSKSIFKFLILFLLNVLVFTAISVYLLSLALEQGFQWVMFFNLFGVLILALTFGSAIRISRDSFLRRQEEKNAELKLLKAQLNPHFLFNTLNNLYGLSVIKSDKLPDLMLKLSDLLRYSLYDTKETYVSLEKEIQYLENYMSLEKIRLENQTEITLHKSGNISGKRIAPMLLIVFVENAFKHLASSKDMRSKVFVDITVTNEALLFSCINSIGEPTKEIPMETGKSGIGLENARKRLSMLYPEKYQLTIENNNSEYQVLLSINF